MSFLLDTNICSEHIKRPRGLMHRFVQHSGGLYVASIVVGELFTWAYRRQDSSRLLTILERDLLSDLVVLDFDRRCGERFGKLQAGLLAQGVVVNPLAQGVVVNPVDLMIANVALVHDLTFVTHNVKHFAAIPELRIVDWIK